MILAAEDALDQWADLFKYFLADVPIAAQAKHDLQRLVQEPKDYFPGLAAERQNTPGRVEIYTTTFETMERKIRDQLACTSGAGGFDSGA
jgi:hypothetical protein